MGIPSDLMTPYEAARKLRTSKGALYERIARGEVPHYRIGRLIRVREVDLAAYLRRHVMPARPSRYARHPEA